MKVATVTYNGRMRSENRTGPSGTSYHWRQSDNGSSEVSVSSLEDAERFESLGVFSVEWTPQGKVARMAGDTVSGANSVLKELSYRQKQRLTSALDLEVKGNAPEEELDEALGPAVEEMTDTIDNR